MLGKVKVYALISIPLPYTHPTLRISFPPSVVRGCSLFRCDHTHTHTKLALQSERFSDFQFGFGLIDTNTAMWEGCYRATVQRERELAVVMCTLRLPLHSTAWWRCRAGRSTHLPTHTPAYRGLIFAIRTLSIYSRRSLLLVFNYKFRQFLPIYDNNIEGTWL